MYKPSLFARGSLKTKVTVFTLSTFLISIWLLSYYASHMLHADMQNVVSEQQFSTVTVMADDINDELEERFEFLAILGSGMTPARMTSAAAAQQLLDTIPLRPRLFNAGVFITGMDGIAIASAPRTANRIGVHYADQDFMHAALKEGRASVGKPIMDGNSEAPTIFISVPIRDARGEVIGALSGAIDLGKPNFLNNIFKHNYGLTGSYFLNAPQHGLIVAATNKSRVMQPIPSPGVNPLLDQFLRGYKGYGISRNSAGVEQIASAKDVALAGWILVVTMPTQEAFAPIYDMQQRMLWGTLLLSVLLGALTWWVVQRQLSPMLDAIKQLSDMPNMSGNSIPSLHLPVARHDEIGDLFDAFNRLFLALTKRGADLHESEMRFRTLIDNNNANIVQIDAANGQILDANAAACSFYGCTPEQVHTLSTLQITDLDPAQEAAGRLAAATGMCNQFVLSIRLANGEKRTVELYSTAITVGGKTRLVGIIHDISRRKLAEAEMRAAKAEAEKANRAKSSFLAAASHDLRQPLSALSLYIGVLKNRPHPENINLVSRIQACCDGLTGMLSNLLDVSKLDAGGIMPRKTDFRVQGILSSQVAVHAGEAAIKGLRIHFRPCGALVTHTDQQLLTRMVGNLIVNAIRYTEKGGILVACRPHAGKRWIEVWDTGVGIPEDKTEMIFQEFTQLENGARTLGSGLGLAIVAKTAALLGLQIRLCSKIGQGSMFAIEVPPGRANPPDVFRSIVKSLRIGLVEGNVELREAIVMALEAIGHEVVAASSGQSLFQQLGDRAPNIIISDYRLGDGETGLDVIDAARRSFNAHLPAIVMTSGADQEPIRSMGDRGILVAFKPFHIATFEMLFAQIYDRRAP
jgi:PAS domain S-box-containing protein